MITKHFTPIGVTLETIDQLVREQEMDAVALYMAYCAVAQWQSTHQVKATNGFMITRTGWTKERFGKAKRVLISKGLIQNIRNTTETNQIEGWYIKINHIVSDEVIIPDEATPPDFHGGGNPNRWKTPPPSAFNESKVLSTKQSPSETDVSQENDENYEAVDDEGNPLVVKQKADTTYKKLYQLWWDKYPVNWNRNRTQISSAKNLLEEHGMEQVEKALTFWRKYKSDPFCPDISTPYDLDSKWDKLLQYKKRIS